MRLVSYLSVVGLCLLLTRVAQAGAPVVAPPPTEGLSETRPVEYDDYRLMLLGVDVAAISMLVGAAYLSTEGMSSTPLALAGLAGYALGGPSVHLAHEQHSRALSSLGLRLGLPVAGLMTGVGLYLSCPDDGCGQTMLGVGVLLANGGVLAAMIVDDAFLGKAPKVSSDYEARPPSPFRFTVAPLLDPRKKTRGLSLVGTF